MVNKATKQSPLKNGNPSHTLTAEEQRAGGRKSGKVRAKNRTFKDILEQLGRMQTTDSGNRKIMAASGVADEEMTNDMAKMFRLEQKAQSGDLRAIELLAKLRKQLTDQVEFNDITPPQPLSPRKANLKKEEKK